jgi:O-antigen/teichoic acid export membrane protein
MKKIINKLFNLENHRNKKLGKNIFLTILFQFSSVGISFLILPISLSIVPVAEYGVWLTISSVFMWLGYFDLGLGTGLKNRLSEALAKSDFKLAKRLISTSYFTIILMMLIVGVLYNIIAININIAEIFGNPNENIVSNKLLIYTTNFVIYVFLVRFVLQLINPIFESMQKLYSVKLILLLSQLLVLTILFIIKYNYFGNIFVLGIIFSLSPVLILFISSIIFFINNKNIAPNIKSIDFKLLKNIYSLGIKFFIIQLNMLVLFQSSNFIIINYIGAEEVVKYNVVFNLFSMMNIAFSTISAPYWSAYTNAWIENDVKWIKNSQIKLIKIWGIICVISLIVLLISDRIYILWIGDKVSIPFTLSLSIYLYMCMFTFGMIYNIFVNSTGKVLLQTISLTILTIIFIPLVIFLINNFNLGLNAIPIALLTVSLYTVIIAPIQSKKIINGTARGIFNR